MDIGESCGSSEGLVDDGNSAGRLEFAEPLTRPLAARLHSRIMAASYKYKLVSPEEEREGDGQQNQRAAHSKGQRFSLMKVCVGVMVVIMVILTALLAWSLSLVDTTQDCVTAECVDVSAYILRKMNRSVDPCHDFYTFSCGGWESANTIPPGRAKYDTFAEVNTRNQDIIRTLLEEESTVHQGKNSSAVVKLKAYYRTCMDTDRIEADGTQPILKKIEELGGWSVSADYSGEAMKSWDLVSSLIAFHKLGFSPIFAFYLSTDNKNNSQRMFSFSQSGLTLDSREEYLKDTDKFKIAFLAFAVKVGMLLGGDNSTHQKMEAVYDLEKRLAEIFMEKEMLRDPALTYNVMTVAEFQKLVGDQVDVKRLMTGVLDKAIADSQVVMVPTVDYFRKLGPVLANTSAQALQDYLVWHMVQLITGYLPQSFIEAAMVLSKVEIGVSTVIPRWQRCVSKAESAFSFVSGALYVNKAFPPESKQQALRILKEVQKAFIDNLDTLSWMDQQTHSQALTKATAMDRALGYPDWILDPQRLDDYYEKAEVREGEFLNNYFAVSKYETDRMWAKQGKAPDKDEWGSNPDEANAFFSSTFNQITIQAGLLQRPYFDPHYPLSFAFGSMGMISGHELTHGFDSSGRKFNAKGNMEDWWSAESSQAFEKNSLCMVKQYSSFTWDDGTHLNGNYTLGENIADNGGLKLGYKAYLGVQERREGEEPRLPAMALTPHQLFFVGFAQIWCAHYTPEYARHSILTDVHTISKFRVQGSVSNMPEFAEAFHCPAGTPHNPQHRCRVW